MKLIYKMLGKDPDNRDNIITVTSGLSIVVNLLIAGIKVLIGIITSSIAILSEGANNASDALTSVLTLLGTKIAGKHPDKKHPFGYRRIEYLTGLVIAVLILVAGAEMLLDSVKLIFKPQDLSVSYLALAIVIGTAVVKFFLGLYTIRMGEKADSVALKGVGIDCRNDCISSVITILSILVFLLFHISLDAYAGILISLLIIKAGIDILKETISELIGRSGEKELADKIYKEIRNTDIVVGAADMMLHNYGPDTWSGSVNVEIDHSKSVGEVYQCLHALQLRIMHEYAVTMVFGIYGVDNDNPETKEMRRTIGAFVKEHDLVKSFHALYLDTKTCTLYCDFIVDYKLRDWSPLKSEFLSYMKEHYPQYTLELTIETEYV